MLNVPMSDARNQTVIVVRPASSPPHSVDFSELPDTSNFTLLACADAHAAERAIRNGCRVGMLLLRTEEDVRQLPSFLPVLRMAEAAWIAVCAPALVRLPQVRECIGELLFNFFTLPACPEHLLLSMRHAWGMAYLRNLHGTGRVAVADENDRIMVGKTPQMQRLFTQIHRVARTDASVLINGASGTGKELAAQSIHRQSDRSNGPFVAVNCGAIAPQLFQSELFGHEKGAFTGASQRKIGRIEAARGGTLFLDEIGDMPFDMQVNLLRFLQEKTIERVGASDSIAVDVRIIAATHINLAEAVANRQFREDLYYRINVVCITIPRLADRGQDIEDLALHYFAKFARTHNRSLRGFSRNAMQMLLAYAWPGNVRELVNRVQRAAVMAEGRFIQPEDLGFDRNSERDVMMTLEEARASAERVLIQRALSQSRNQVSRAALMLGVSRVTLYRLIEKHNIENNVPATLTNPPLAANEAQVPLEPTLLTQS